MASDGELIMMHLTEVSISSFLEEIMDRWDQGLIPDEIRLEILQLVSTGSSPSHFALFQHFLTHLDYLPLQAAMRDEQYTIISPSPKINALWNRYAHVIPLLSPEYPKPSSGLAGDLENETLANTDYRHVLDTTIDQQLVLMSLLPGEEIGWEIHEDTTQFIRLEKGELLAQRSLSAERADEGLDVILTNGQHITVAPQMYHNIINTGSEPLKLYTIYSPPHHPLGLIQPTKVE